MSDEQSERDALARLRAAAPDIGDPPSLSALEGRLRRRLGQFGDADHTAADHEIDAALDADPDPLDEPDGGSHPRLTRALDSEDAGDHVEPGPAGRAGSPRVPRAWLAAAAAAAVVAAGTGYVVGERAGDRPLLDVVAATQEENAAATEDLEGAPGDVASEDGLVGDDGAPEPSAELTADSETGRLWPTAVAEEYLGWADRSVSAPPTFVLLDADMPASPLDPPDAAPVTALTPITRTGPDFTQLAQGLGLQPVDGVPLGSGSVMVAEEIDPDDDEAIGATLSLTPTGTVTLTLPAGHDRVPNEIVDGADAEEFARSITSDLGLAPDAVDWVPERMDGTQWRIRGSLAETAATSQSLGWDVVFAPDTGVHGPAGDLESGVVRATGPLVTVEPLGERPVLSVKSAVERLNDPRFGALAAAELPPLFQDRTNAGRAHRDADVEDSLRWASATLDLSDPGFGEGRYLSPDGITYLVPIYQFWVDDAYLIEVIALDDATLGLD